MPPRWINLSLNYIRSVGYLLLGGFDIYIGCRSLLDSSAIGFAALLIGLIIFVAGLINLIKMWST